MPEVTPKIAFLGTGLMGLPMARRLLAAGFPLTAWNRDASKTAPLVQEGAHLAATPAEAVAGANIVFTMLSDGKAVEAVLFGQGASAAMTRGATVIDTSSIAPAIARDHAQRLSALGIGHLDAPVSGGVAGARAGTLAIMAGGPAELVTDMAQVLAPLGRTTHVGPSGAGQTAKLANQQIVAITIGAVAEALLMVRAAGGSPAAFRQAIRGGFADSRILDQHGERMVCRNFEPGGPSRLQLKDLDTALALARELSLTLPLTHTVRDEFAALCNAGQAELDHSALLLYLETLNDRTPPALTPEANTAR